MIDRSYSPSRLNDMRLIELEDRRRHAIMSGHCQGDIDSLEKAIVERKDRLLARREEPIAISPVDGVTAKTIQLACDTADQSVPVGEMRFYQLDPKELAIEAGYKESDITKLGGLVDPLDVKYDGVKLSGLLNVDRMRRMDHNGYLVRARGELTPAQRAAASAHWSAQLRAKVAASKAAERNVVTYCEEDEP